MTPMDEHPYIELITSHAAAIERICRSFGRTAEDREDLRQDILLNLWRGWKHYRPDHRPITWLYRVALNTAISWRRHRGRQVTTIPLDAFDLPDDTALHEQAVHLRSLMLHLPTADQRMLELYLDGFSSSEIASVLGISQTAVTTRMGRIKEKLRKMREI